MTIKAVYRQRDDGDYEFVAAFDENEENGSDWATQVIDYLSSKGEVVLLCDEDSISDFSDIIIAEKKLWKVRADVCYSGHMPSQYKNTILANTFGDACNKAVALLEADGFGKSEFEITEIKMVKNE